MTVPNVVTPCGVNGGTANVPWSKRCTQVSNNEADIIPEPLGGAHWDYAEAAALLKPKLIETINELKKYSAEYRIEKRIEKFSKMGFWNEVAV